MTLLMGLVDGSQLYNTIPMSRQGYPNFGKILLSIQKW